MSSEVLLAEDLSFSYGSLALLQHLRLEVLAGQKVGVLGLNGAGKSTCFGLLAGTLRPGSGRILLHGQDVTAWPLHLRARAGLRFLPQDSTLLAGLSVEDNLRVALEALGGSGLPELAGNTQLELDRCLSLLGLTARRRHKAGLLSGGERRRTELARALLGRPALLILDEPFAGLDASASRILVSALDDIAAEGIGVLLTDHQAGLLAAHCDRLYLLYDGTMVAEGTAEVFARHPVVRAHYPALQVPRSEPGAGRGS